MKRAIPPIRHFTYLLIFGFFAADFSGAPGSAVAADSSAMPDAAMIRQMMPRMAPSLAPERMDCPEGRSPRSRTGGGEWGLVGGLDPWSDGRREAMDRPFFLDRTEALGLSAEQVSELKEIRGACRRDTIRAVAEARIKRLELVDLLEGEWTVAAAETLIRDIQKLSGDIQVRHLTAIQEARKVLTEEQLRQVDGGDAGSMEQLFH